jgi:hypothetical protein
MLRRSERILKKPQRAFDKLVHLTNSFQDKFDKNRTKNDRIYILSELYKTVYSDFYELRHDIHKSNVGKEEYFIKILNSLEKSGRVLLNELLEPDIQGRKSSNALKRNIIKTSKKIRKYIETCNTEQKEAFIRLSSKIGLDLVKNIKSYL